MKTIYAEKVDYEHDCFDEDLESKLIKDDVFIYCSYKPFIVNAGLYEKAVDLLRTESPETFRSVLLEKEWLAALLPYFEKIRNKKFKLGRLDGKNKYEHMYIICPKDYDEYMMKYLEAVAFSTGTMYHIAKTKCENVDEFEEADKFLAYTYLTDRTEVKNWVKDKFGDKKFDVTLVKMVPRYEEI